MMDRQNKEAVFVKLDKLLSLGRGTLSRALSLSEWRNQDAGTCKRDLTDQLRSFS